MVGVLAHVAAAATLPFCLFVSWFNKQEYRFVAVRLLPLGLLLSGVISGLVYFYPDTIQTYHTVHTPDFRDVVVHFFWLWSRLITTAHWLLLPVWKYQRWELFIGLCGFAGFVVASFRRVSPVAEWGFWILVTTLPFINLLPKSFLADNSGPSRYLYLASAGSSLIIAWSLHRGKLWLSQHLSPLSGKALYVSAIAALLISSFVALDRAEALSFYNTVDIF